MRTITRILIPILFTSLAVYSQPSYATDAEVPAVLRKVGFDQHLNEQVPMNLVFTDENANPVKLGDYFGKKPVILVLAYYECPMLCTLVLNGVVQGMRDMPFSVGTEFNVVTVSFNPRETPDLAAAKKKNYVASYGRPGAADGWHFLTGKQEEIDKLTKAVGFRYVYDAKHNQYIHTSGIMILTPQGKISRYFYGIQFPGRDLRLGLVEAAADKIGSPTDQILLYCFHYDPETGKYTASILTFVRAGGVLIVLGLIGMVWFLLRWEGRKRGGAASQATTATTGPSNGVRGDGV
jgi:protein SCO1